VAAAVADARDTEGRPQFGIDLPTPQGLGYVEALNAARFPLERGDRDLEAAAAGLNPVGVLVSHSFERVMPGRDYVTNISHACIPG